MRHFRILLLLALCVTLNCEYINAQDAPLKVTMCELYEHPEQYAGKMVKVRANVSGSDLSLDDFSNQKACSAYMRLHLELPQQTKPTPSFNLMGSDYYNELLEKLHQGMNVIATYEGRFDPLFVWRNQKRIRVGGSTEKGYGKRQQYDGRIVLQKVSDILARTVPRR